MIKPLRPWLAIAAGASLTISLWAQAPADAPQLKILSPDEDTYLTGMTRLRASVTVWCRVRHCLRWKDCCWTNRPPSFCR